VNQYADALGTAACKACPLHSEAPAQSDAQSDCLCSLGFYGHAGGPCVECPANQYADALGTPACAACPAHSQAPPRSDAQTDCLCSLGFYGAHGGPCAPCGIDTYAPAIGLPACLPCPADAVALGGSDALTDCECRPGFFGPAGAACTQCAANTYAPAIGMAACEQCPAHSVAPPQSDALVLCRCDLGYSGEDGGPCAACAAGEYKEAVGDAACAACPAHSHSAAASPALASCLCNAGFTGSDGGPCEACAAGKYKEVSGSAVCTDCPAHAHSPGASATRSSCLCNAGFSGPDGGTCEACAAGNFKEAPGAAPCVACGAGKFLTTTAATTAGACVACGAGKFSTAVGADSAGTCVACAADTYSTAEGAVDVGTCASCPEHSQSPEGSDAQNDCLCSLGFSGAHGGPCTECPANQYADALGMAACTACLANSEAPARSVANTSCLCVPGFYGEPAGPCTMCAADTYSAALGTTACALCPTNAQAPPGSTTITACACNAGYAGLNGGACTACAAGSFKDSVGEAPCVECAAGKFLESTAAVSADACVACAAGTYSVRAGAALASACVVCAPGTYSTTVGASAPAVCLACPVDTFSPAAGAAVASTCEACPASTVAPEGSSARTACRCVAGFTGPDGGECAQCAAGKHKAAIGDEACTDCAAGKFSTAQGAVAESTCVACAAGKFSPAEGAAAESTCEDCAAGKFSGAEGAAAESTCAPCPARSDSPAGSTVVVDCECDPGYTGPDGGECAACPYGTFKPLAGAQACTLCAVDTYGTASAAVDAGVCAACPAHSSSVSGSSGIELCFCADGYRQAATFDACIECAPGFYDDDDRFQCSACGGGLYSETERATGDETCLPCAGGTWSASGSPTCQACPSNSNSAPASALLTDCKCKAGATGADGGACVLCVAGTYKEATGSAACNVCTEHSLSVVGSTLVTMCHCLPGYFGNDGGPCEPCAADSYKDTLGSAVCTLCPADAQAPPASAVVTACKCNVGFSGPDGEECVGCAADTFKDTVGSANCSVCPANAQAPGESPAATSCQCNAGYTGPNGEACAQCAAGKFKDTFGPDACTDCEPGKYLESTGALSVAACVACAAGKFSTTTGAPLESECVRCEAGKYSTTVGAASESTCLGCPAHAHSPSGSDAAVDCLCNAGYTGANGGECSACVPGKFKDAPGPASCTECAPGRYLTTAGAYLPEACVKCGPGTFSTTSGADSPATCLACAAHTYSTTEGAPNASFCLECPQHASSPPGTSVLTGCRCNLGYFGQDGGLCEICAPDTYADALGTPACVACPLHSESPQGSDALTDCRCSLGFFGEHGGPCAGCPADTYAPALGSASCTACPLHAVAPNRSTAVTACECVAGFFGPHEGPCAQCPVDTYKAAVGAGGADSCVPCPPYSSTRGRLGQPRCFCDAGFEEDDASALANTAAQCSACAAGKFNTGAEVPGADAGAAFLRTCIPCDTCGDSLLEGQVATECTATRNITCRACQAHSAPEAGRRLLGPCLCFAGFELADAECAACAVGKSRSANANNAVLCAQCAPGFFADAPAQTACAPCLEQCVGGEQGPGEALLVSEAGRAAAPALLAWLSAAFGFAATSGAVNDGLLGVPLCRADHWTSRYSADARFYYTAHPAPPPNVSRSYPRLCRSPGAGSENPGDALHAVLWVLDPVYFQAFSGANLSTAPTAAPAESWRAGSFGEFMSATFAPCVEARAYLPAGAALCPLRVALEPDGVEWRLSAMRFEAPALLPGAEGTVAQRETQYVVGSADHGSGAFWATFAGAPRLFAVDPTVHRHEYVRVDCHPTHDVVCAACAVCAPGTFPNRTCGPELANDRLDTECANCSVGTVCYGGSGFSPDGNPAPDTPENRPLTCPANSVSAPGATSLAGCQCLAGYYYVVHGDPEDPFTRSECIECPLHHYCPFGSLAPTPCPEHGFTLAGLAGVRLECHCPRGRFRDPPQDEAGFNCSVCTENDFCFDSLRYNCSDELMETLPGSGFAENCTCIETYFNNGSRCDLCSVNHTCAAGVRTGCPTHEWTNGRLGLLHCLCEPGFFRQDGLCEPCPAHHFCTGADDQRQACPHNSLAPEYTGRVAECLCDAGFEVEYSQNASAFHACRACEVRADGTGQFKNYVGNAACADCTLCDPLEEHTTTAVHCTASTNTVCEACQLCQHVNVSGRDVDYQATACQKFSQTVCAACLVCNYTVEWQSVSCQETVNRECEPIDFTTPCATGSYRGNHTRTKNSECLPCSYQDTPYQASHLHEAVTDGQRYNDALSCRVRCLPFSRLRDPERHWLGCATCETGNVLFKRFRQDESSLVCNFTCAHGHVERRNAEGIDGDCVPGLLASSGAYFAHALNVTNVQRVRRADNASAANASAADASAALAADALAAFRVSLSHTTHGHFVVLVGPAAPACSEHARQHVEQHCCFAALWRVSTKRQMGLSARRDDMCSRAAPPWSVQTSDSQLEFEIPDARLHELGVCRANGTGLDCDVVVSIVDTVLFKSASTTLRLQVQRGSAHAMLNDAHRYVPLTGFAVEVQLAYFEAGSPVFLVVTNMAPLPGAGMTLVAVRGVGMQFVDPASALACGRLSIAGDTASRRNWTLEHDSTAALTFLRGAPGHSLVQLYYTLRLVDREDPEAAAEGIPNQMDVAVWRNVSLRRPVCEPELGPQDIDTGVVFSASGLGADAVAQASRLLTPDHSVRGELGALTSFVALSRLRHIARVRVASMLLASTLQPALLDGALVQLSHGRLAFTPQFRQACLAARSAQSPACAYQYVHYDPHVHGIHTFSSCAPAAQAAARAWLRLVFGLHDDGGHVAALCARAQEAGDYAFTIAIVNTRAFLPRTPQWQALQSRSSPAHASRVFALFRFE
jgi:hypothetical protein